MKALRLILKSSPAVLLALLVLAWATTTIGEYGYIQIVGGKQFACGGGFGSIGVACYPLDPSEPAGWLWRWRTSPLSRYHFLGSLTAVTELPGGAGWAYGCNVPFILLLTLLCPLAAGPFVRFRFRLWHWLVYTALIGLQLAYHAQAV